MQGTNMKNVKWYYVNGEYEYHLVQCEWSVCM